MGRERLGFIAGRREMVCQCLTTLLLLHPLQLYLPLSILLTVWRHLQQVLCSNLRPLSIYCHPLSSHLTWDCQLVCWIHFALPAFYISTSPICFFLNSASFILGHRCFIRLERNSITSLLSLADSSILFSFLKVSLLFPRTAHVTHQNNPCIEIAGAAVVSLTLVTWAGDSNKATWV